MTPRAKRRINTPELRAELVARVVRGEQFEAIAAALGCCSKTARRVWRTTATAEQRAARARWIKHRLLAGAKLGNYRGNEAKRAAKLKTVQRRRPAVVSPCPDPWAGMGECFR